MPSRGSWKYPRQLARSAKPSGNGMLPERPCPRCHLGRTRPPLRHQRRGEPGRRQLGQLRQRRQGAHRGAAGRGTPPAKAPGCTPARRPRLRAPVTGSGHGASGAGPCGARPRTAAPTGACRGRRGSGSGLSASLTPSYGVGPGRLGAAVDAAGRFGARGERRRRGIEPAGCGSGLWAAGVRRRLHRHAQRRVRAVGHGARGRHGLAPDPGGCGGRLLVPDRTRRGATTPARRRSTASGSASPRDGEGRGGAGGRRPGVQGPDGRPLAAWAGAGRSPESPAPTR